MTIALKSHFQPIFSLAHRRVVGYEALLRGTMPDGTPVSPPELFARCQSVEEQTALDVAACELHAGSFARFPPQSHWLFLNVDASIFSRGNAMSASQRLQQICRQSGLAPHQIVVEILETAIDDHVDLEAQVRELKAQGFLLALDDFGAGHSNFDRVFTLAPTLVKLDRSVVVKAAQSQTVRRVTTQMVSLLHECGALVLMEGVERREEAVVALDSDTDFVQGYFFGRPAAQLLPPAYTSEEIEDTWALCGDRWHEQRRAYRNRLQPYVQAMEHACAGMQAGATLAEACAGFLGLHNADVCYLLDASGHQVGVNLFSPGRGLVLAERDAFAPLRDTTGARWSRRPYFRRALADVGVVQVTRPYRTMQSLSMCITLSVSVERHGQRLIICGDMEWTPVDVRPDFSDTVS
ncbi:EAL domain-containing protein [Acidovorax sp.]|uniref:EAL domain-containing protein n=1 Tax=Acidovorax sp. TaxID=1872122 RepID=UPI00391F346F